MGVARSPSGTSNASASECAGSVETTTVRSPASDARNAVAAATVVLPTPPLPVNSRMRMKAGRLRDPLDLFLQLFERVAHDESRRAALQQARQRHADLDREVVVHA